VTIERFDPEAAEATLQSLHPNEALRSRCLTFFADAIQQAHGLGEAKWSVTPRKRQVSLNVGKLLAVGLSKGRVYLGLPPTRLPEALSGLLESHGVWDKEFSTFPTTQLIELSADSFLELLEQLRAPFADFLRIAADTAKQPPVSRSHSPGVLAYLQKVVGRELPGPVYASRSEEEEPEQDTPRPRAVAIQTPQVLFERVEYNLVNLLSYVELGHIGLPDLQRPFVWKWSKVRDLWCGASTPRSGAILSRPRCASSSMRGPGRGSSRRAREADTASPPSRAESARMCSTSSPWDSSSR
jgi:hypothetical protein